MTRAEQRAARERGAAAAHLRRWSWLIGGCIGVLVPMSIDQITGGGFTAALLALFTGGTP